MSKSAKSFKDVEKTLRKFAKSAKSEIPKELHENWNSAISGVNAEAIGNAGAKLIGNVTGNSRTAKRTRSSVETAVKNAQKTLSTKKKSTAGRKFVFLSLITAAIVAVVVASQKKTAMH